MILQRELPVAPWMTDFMLRLPGTTPIAVKDWLQRDDVFVEQMAYRDRLITERADDVHRLAETARPAAEELLALVLGHLETVPGYGRRGPDMLRPDGVSVPLDGPPLIVAGRLAQEDFILLEKPEGAAEHVLTGAILCFPSNWTLAEKFGMTMGRIHLPIESYDENIARRVQRMLDFLRPEAPIMRANLLIYGEADLFNARPEFDRHLPETGQARFIRVERQSFMRLPISHAVVFSIHTYMVRPETLTPEQLARLDEVRPGIFDGRGEAG